jgi:hypothetical protein
MVEVPGVGQHAPPAKSLRMRDHRLERFNCIGLLHVDQASMRLCGCARSYFWLKDQSPDSRVASNGDWKPYCDIKPSPRLIGSTPPFLKDHFFHGLYWLQLTTFSDHLLYLEKWGYLRLAQQGVLNYAQKACIAMHVLFKQSEDKAL